MCGCCLGLCSCVLSFSLLALPPHPPTHRSPPPHPAGAGPALRSHRCTDGCRREPGTAGRTRDGGASGEGWWGRGGRPAARQVLLSPEAWVQLEDSLACPTKAPSPHVPTLPSVTEPQPPPQERLPLPKKKGVPGLRLDKSWVDPSAPPRRQHCAKSC